MKIIKIPHKKTLNFGKFDIDKLSDIKYIEKINLILNLHVRKKLYKKFDVYKNYDEK